MRTHLKSNVFLFGTLLLAGFIVSNMYSSGLASIMTVPQYEKSIDTVVDLAASGMKWYGPSPYGVEEIWKATKPHLRKIVKAYVSTTFEEMAILAHMGESGFFIEQAQHELCGIDY
uniref:Uncharacterized protein n=1 Tax=Anopheles farauti TaxID=69004 RepID=A0A182QGG8_9DIPT